MFCSWLYLGAFVYGNRVIGEDCIFVNFIIDALVVDEFVGVSKIVIVC
jgi:hypothetical protein